MRGLYSILTILTILMLSSAAASGRSEAESVVGEIHFRSIGPTRQGGRIMDFGVPDPKKRPHTFYVAASTGGLWKTTDGGLTYEPVFDDVEINAIGDVAVSHSSPDTVWVGTGNFSYWGEGVWRSLDGGESWEHRGLPESYSITRIRIHPSDPDVVYVAANGSPVLPGGERGVYKTSDGGATWTKSLDVRVGERAVGAADIVLHPTDPEILYASSWDRESGAGTGIYKTTDGGESWERLSGGLPEGPLERIGLDIYLANPDVVVACILLPGSASDSPYDLPNTVYRSDDAGATWRRISPPWEEFQLRGAPRFAQIRIDPKDDRRIHVLNTGVQGTLDGGDTWQKTIRYGGDNQAMWINPYDSSHILLGYDYGMAISRSRGETWFHPDNLPLGQVEAVGFDMDFPYNVYGGMQDFGTWKGPSTKRGRFPIRFEDWEHVQGADGSYAQVDPIESRWLYVESQRGEISRNDQKTGVRRSIRYEREGIRFNFIAPILISPHDSDVVYHGAEVLLRSPFRGEAWEEISPDLTNGVPEKPRREISGAITTISESPLVAGLLWVGTDDGNVHVTRDGGKIWTKLNDAVPDKPPYRVSRVEASHHDPAAAYLSLEGRRSRHDLRPYVYRTRDYGATWVSIASGLPDEPVNVIREDPKNPELLFVGTAKGIYVSLDAGASWISMRNDMPNVPIHDLAIHPRENDLIVGSYGRSFWIADISPLQELTPEVLAKDLYLFSIEPQVLWIHAGQTQVAHGFQNYAGENAPHGVVVNYYLSRPADDVSVQIYRGTRLIEEYAGPGEPGRNSVEWYLTERIPRSDEEKLEYDEWAEEVLVEEEFFDYYDGTDHFGAAGDEVSVFGRSLEIWIHPLPEWRERDWKRIRARPGEYTVKLIVDGRERTGKVLVVADHWYDRR